MDYQFVTSSTTFNEERTHMYITINISEGVKYELGDITYEGNYAVNDRSMKKIIKLKKAMSLNRIIYMKHFKVYTKLIQIKVIFKLL